MTALYFLFRLFKVKSRFHAIMNLIVTTLAFAAALYYGFNSYDPAMEPWLFALIIIALPTAISLYLNRGSGDNSILIFPSVESYASYGIMMFFGKLLLFCILIIIVGIPVAIIRYVLSIVYIIVDISSSKKNKDSDNTIQ